MNKTIEDGLKELVKALKDGVKFSKKELPQVAKELLERDLYLAKFGVVVSIILTIGGIVSLTLGINQENFDLKFIEYFISFIVAIPGLGFFMCNLHTIVSIKKAPRVYLIEAIKDFLEE